MLKGVAVHHSVVAGQLVGAAVGLAVAVDGATGSGCRRGGGGKEKRLVMRTGRWWQFKIYKKKKEQKGK